MNKKRIRIATLEDAAQLLAIYKPYVEQTAITFEYEVPSVDEFRERIRKTVKRYPYLVLEEENGEIVGYCYASCFKDRAAYDWSVETSIYLKQECRGQGYGRLLYDKLEEYLRQQHVLNVNACIAYTEKEDVHLNRGSVHFHEKRGYTLVGRFHNSGYKFGTWYDMIWMEKMIGTHETKVEAFLPFCEIRKG